jgi:HAD superfamily phosphoserine phosphatase-like hydrolase
MSRFFYCFDLDGTVTSEELLPRIASELRMEAEMARLTASAMAGDVPFEVSLRRRVELLKGLSIARVQEVVLGVGLNAEIVEFLLENREQCAIVTGNLDCWIEPLMKRLGVRWFSSRTRRNGDQLLGLDGVLSKVAACADLPRPLCAVGDGNNDVEMIEIADVGVAFGGVHPPAETLLDVASHAIYSAPELCRFLRAL